MALTNQNTIRVHKEIVNSYKERLEKLESDGSEEQEEPYERSYLHNAIYLHRLWFEQDGGSEDNSSPLLNEILERRDSDLSTFKQWMNEFANTAKPNGWAIWGWAHSLKTFVGFPIRSHDECVPLGVTPMLVLDCWEHSWIPDFELDFDAYLDQIWSNMNWNVIEQRHHELARLFGYGMK